MLLLLIYSVLRLPKNELAAGGVVTEIWLIRCGGSDVGHQVLSEELGIDNSKPIVR